MATNDIISTHFFDSIVNNIDHNELNIECQRWALAHGKCGVIHIDRFVQRRFTNKDNNESCVIPYPFTIYPSPYPRHEYNKARQIQYAINAFIQRLSWNPNLMDTIFQRFIDCDPFIRRLRNIFNEIPCRSIAEACIIRTDYMLQSVNNIDTQRTKLRLTEMNTIAVGLGAAAKLMYAWHKRVLMRIRPELVLQLPENESYDLIINTLFESWQIYNNSNAIILFIVPEREFNIGDQLLIEQGLLSRQTQCLLVKHVTFMDICHYCSLNADGTLYFRNVEVALVYYRCAYDPQHFTSEDIWQAYIMLESSRAIKCPSLRYHLAGMKCFQLALVENRFLEEIFPNEKEYIDDFRQITEEMFTIDQATNDPILRQRILTQPESFYLKQSREGGGNVYCGAELKKHLNEIIADKQSNRYFLMARIYPPTCSSLVRSSELNQGLSVKEINGELGIFGSLISQNGNIISERIGGSLFRSKSAINIEGGIASGHGCIDSVILV